MMSKNSTSRPVVNPPAQAEARNRANAAPRQADRDAPCRGLDRLVFATGGAARNSHRALLTSLCLAVERRA
jgi:hypothetical protein